MSLLKGKMAAGGVPPGAYTARFLGLEEVPADPLKGYGGGIKWLFEVLAGDHVGQRASRITTATPSPKNGCGKLLAGLLGKSLAPGEDYDLTPLVGTAFVVMVAATESGSSRVESAAPLPPAAA